MLDTGEGYTGGSEFVDDRYFLNKCLLFPRPCFSRHLELNVYRLSLTAKTKMPHQTNDSVAQAEGSMKANSNTQRSTSMVDAPEKGETTFISAQQSIDPVVERRIVWKFDLRILPLLAAMYLFNSLDKSNMGNAKTAGLVKDLGLKGNQYNILLSVSHTSNP